MFNMCLVEISCKRKEMMNGDEMVQLENSATHGKSLSDTFTELFKMAFHAWMGAAAPALNSDPSTPSLPFRIELNFLSRYTYFYLSFHFVIEL